MGGRAFRHMHWTKIWRGKSSCINSTFIRKRLPAFLTKTCLMSAIDSRFQTPRHVQWTEIAKTSPTNTLWEQTDKHGAEAACSAKAFRVSKESLFGQRTVRKDRPTASCVQKRRSLYLFHYQNPPRAAENRSKVSEDVSRSQYSMWLSADGL